jgi:DNA segregation ATPase FtsK/SpoIIIE, S-DNA-T family
MGKEKANRRITPRGRPRESGRTARTGMARDIAAVLLLALGVATALALTTYSSIDGALIARHLSPANLIGPVGHRAASAVYRVLGFAALVVPCGLVTVAWRLFRGAPGRLTTIGALAYASLTLCLATLSHLLLEPFELASFPAGGLVGAALSARSVALLSTTGSVLLVAAAATVSLIVATGIKVTDAAAMAWRGLMSLAGFLGSRLGAAVQEHREAVADMRAEEEADRQRRTEAEAMAEAAWFDGAHEVDRQDARAMAGALALEQVRRPFFDEPAWVDGLVPMASAEPEPAFEARAELEPIDPPRRKRKKAEPQPSEAAEFALVDAPEPTPSPTLLPPPPARPEIVVPAALLERGRKKKEKEKKEVPSFAFTKAGDVFRLPSTDLLDVHEEKAADVDKANLTRTADVIAATLAEHGIDGQITYIRPGPVVTLYEFLPVGGTKLSRIENLDKELTMALAATRIRIIAPIPGKGVVGIEVPNKDRGTVFLRDILESETFGHAGGFLPLGLGKDIEGTPYCVDLQKMPHLLIAGTTGAGKSVGLNTMILSMLFRQTPAEVRMIMVDPKMTELSPYEDIPHLLLPVVTDPQKASRALQWAVDEMERRTQILADTGVRDLKSYNAKVDKHRAEGTTFEDKDLALPPRKLVVVDVTAGETEEAAAARAEAEAAAKTAAPLAGSAEFADPTAPPPADPVAERDTPRLPQKLPYIVVIIDELADLMMTAPREVETSLARLAAKARATGIHLVVATQRPSTDVVTGTIKNNFPARISFRLGNRHDSTTIINGPGAESLLGNGDMLVMTATAPLTRVQGAYVSEEELKRVVDFLKEQGKPVYDDSILKARDGFNEGSRDSDLDDPVYDQAMELVARMDEVSVSKLQREMRLGYNKAAKIIERMEREGLVGPPNGVKPRQVLMRGATPGEYEARPNL